MRLLGIDFETTGLSTSESRIVEAGWAIWDTDLKSITFVHDELVYHSDEPAFQDGAEKAHGLSWPIIKQHGSPIETMLLNLQSAMMQVDAVVAHNGNNYDHPILKSNAARAGMGFPERLWIDTSLDVPYPQTMTTRRLVHLAAEHGFLNPFPHRAIFDVVTMLHVLSHYDIVEVVKNASAATIRVRAAGITYDKRDLPKARRYRWEPAGKFWYKDIKDFDLEKERAEAPFELVVLPAT